MALIPFKSQLIADTGISFGDEGKGRLIYEILAELKEGGSRDPIVLKVNGGANSGHTAGGLKLNLLPAGLIDKGVSTLALGSGVVADPRKIWWEALPLEKQGYRIFERLAIDERTLVSDLSHRLLDLAWEDYRVHMLGAEIRGTTGRGITPAYRDEVGQWQIFFADFVGPKELFACKLKNRINRALRVIQHVCQGSPKNWEYFFERLSLSEKQAHTKVIEDGIFEEREFDFTRFRGPEPFTLNMEEVVETYWKVGCLLNPYIVDVREKILAALNEHRYVIGEFGQAFWLDKRHGFPPNVTASHTFTPELFQSAGIPVQPVHTIGCCKAYDTKVGTHLFLTEMPEDHPLGRRLRKLEYGSTTGRQRMVGWFDAVEKGDALRYGGFEDLVINKLDALSYQGEWQDGELCICCGYQCEGGGLLRSVPRNDALRKTLRPLYKYLPGWSEDLTGIRHFVELPINAQRYVAFALKEIISIANRNDVDLNRKYFPNLRYIGVGPEPTQIIKDVPSTDQLLTLLNN